MGTILIVEDEFEIAEHLARFFELNDFSTVHISDGNDVIEAVKQQQPELVILDIMIPGQDGLTCCKEIRQFSNVPIIMLTAKVDEIDRLIGLEAGADDYVCKPFSAPELVMRAKAILKRTQNQVTYQVLSVDPDKQLVFYKNNQINLTALEYSLFHLLFQFPERVYSRQQIIELAYSDLRDITDRAIDSHIKNIRKRFKQAGVNEKIIESVYGAGYKLVLP